MLQSSLSLQHAEVYHNNQAKDLTQNNTVELAYKELGYIEISVT